MNYNYKVVCIDGSEGLSTLDDESVKLIYGSPPYPNAKRNYGVWKSKDYIDKISPFIDQSVDKLSNDGFLVINVKANRDYHGKSSTTRSLVVEKLAIALEDIWDFSCVDIEIWVKTNPIPGGLRVACQDCYEQILWFSKSPSWHLNLDSIRRPYSQSTLDVYQNHTYRPRQNGLSYVRHEKTIDPNPDGALPINVITGSVTSKNSGHQAVQPGYISEKYIKACTDVGDLVVDPWSGSGTTGVEAIKLKRSFIGFDIDSDYVEIAKRNIAEVYNVQNPL